MELLKSLGVVPSAVVGHSSGEIAAAYSIGALSLTSACKVAYYRGQLAETLKKAKLSSPGAMLSANLPADEVRDYLCKMDPSLNLVRSVNVACINSPLNSTLSGPEQAIDLIKEQLDQDRIFAQKLKTGVAYHSPFMRTIATEYREKLGHLNADTVDDDRSSRAIAMVSSVEGELVSSPKVLSTTQYWVDNMVSPVRFSDALTVLASGQLKVGMKPI